MGAGATNLISEADLRKKLSRHTPLRVKLGIDPTASDIHLGFAVVLRRLRQFQDLGHTAVLILGDFTAQVGDPTGRSATRPRLAPEQIEANLETYQAQAGLILRPDRLEVRRNSEWLGVHIMRRGKRGRKLSMGKRWRPGHARSAFSRRSSRARELRYTSVR